MTTSLEGSWKFYSRGKLVAQVATEKQATALLRDDPALLCYGPAGGEYGISHSGELVYLPSERDLNEAWGV